MDLAFYAAAGPLTGLTGAQTTMVRDLGVDAESLCRVAQGLCVNPDDAFGAGLSEQRLVERSTRPAHALLQRAIELDRSPLDHLRGNENRVVGTCRHFAVLATAMLRAAGRPARARCGFAAYFVPSKMVDHWIVEYWHAQDRRWVRIDPEILDRDVVAQPQDLRPGEFLSGGEAWQLVRSGQASAMDFGVFGTGNWGPGEIRANAMRDLAALNKIEMLPWDEWGPMADSYQGTTDEHFDRLIDELSIICANDESTTLGQFYERLPVPADLIC